MEQLRRLSRLEPEELKRPVSARLGSVGHGRDRPAKAAKAEPVRVRADMTAAQGFQAIVASCIRHFRINEPLVIDHRDVEGLHQARVAMRRLRSALSLFRPAIGGEELERLRGELRWFTAKLGDARNLDVLLQRDLPDEERERLGRERERACDAAIAAMESARFRRLMSDLASWVAHGDWRRGKEAAEPLARFAGRRIDRLWRKVSHARKLRAMGDGDRHRLRIQTKKLRYALEFVEALHVHHHKRRKKFGKVAEKVQDALGRAHDLTVARTLLSPPALPTIALQEKEERGHLLEAKRSLRRLRKIGSYWRGRRGYRHFLRSRSGTRSRGRR
jgi:triphosphatase